MSVSNTSQAATAAMPSFPSKNFNIVPASTVVFSIPHLRSAIFSHHAQIIHEREQAKQQRQRAEQQRQRQARRVKLQKLNIKAARPLLSRGVILTNETSGNPLITAARNHAMAVFANIEGVIRVWEEHQDCAFPFSYILFEGTVVREQGPEEPFQAHWQDGVVLIMRNGAGFLTLLPSAAAKKGLFKTAKKAIEEKGRRCASKVRQWLGRRSGKM